MKTFDEKFEVEEGATVCTFSDSKAYTVIEISKNGKSMKIQRDTAILLNGGNSGEADALVFHEGGFAANVTGTQRYKYIKDSNLEILTVKYYKSGWKTVGTKFSVIPERSEFYDYNF